MITETAKVESIEKLSTRTYLIKTYSPQIAREALPGQFCNIKVNDYNFPLLRRPFSVCNVDEDYVFYMFDIHGLGTEILANLKIGDELNILGPLGNTFGFEDDYELAIFVAGGIGIAPFPFLTEYIPNDKEILTFIGGRSEENVIVTGDLENVFIATDDGSLGFKGNVIELLVKNRDLYEGKKVKIFACGPTPMLRALREFSLKENLDCELSTECAMACGFGICQGCAIDDAKNDEKYKLVCVDGPVFKAEDIVL